MAAVSNVMNPIDELKLSHIINLNNSVTVSRYIRYDIPLVYHK